jgi:hypothetical protein
VIAQRSLANIYLSIRAHSQLYSCQSSNVWLSVPPKQSSLQEKPPTDSPIIVDWDSQNDPLNPASQSVPRKLFMTFLVSLLAFSVTATSAIDACGILQYSDDFNVSEVVGSLATGKYRPLK